jgi:hypothetical protein
LAFAERGGGDVNAGVAGEQFGAQLGGHDCDDFVIG